MGFEYLFGKAHANDLDTTGVLSTRAASTTRPHRTLPRHRLSGAGGV
jgi:hypothetical protein